MNLNDALLDKILQHNDKEKGEVEYLREENSKLHKELNKMKAKLNNGIRVDAFYVNESDLRIDAAPLHSANATLILD